MIISRLAKIVIKHAAAVMESPTRNVINAKMDGFFLLLFVMQYVHQDMAYILK